MSRDELAAALTEVAEGRIPKVRALLRPDLCRTVRGPRWIVGDVTAAERFWFSQIWASRQQHPVTTIR